MGNTIISTKGKHRGRPQRQNVQRISQVDVFFRIFYDGGYRRLENIVQVEKRETAQKCLLRQFRGRLGCLRCALYCDAIPLQIA